jgi:hypothetical protein
MPNYILPDDWKSRLVGVYSVDDLRPLQKEGTAEIVSVPNVEPVVHRCGLPMVEFEDKFIHPPIGTIVHCECGKYYEVQEGSPTAHWEQITERKAKKLMLKNGTWVEEDE